MEATSCGSKGSLELKETGAIIAEQTEHGTELIKEYIMSKIDLKKDLKHLYSASSKEPALVDVPTAKFLMIDGKGDPNHAPEFREAVEALYGTAYTLKFMLKKRGIGPEYAVMPLEGLWWVEDMRLFSAEKKDDWLWTLMIMQPEWVTEELFREAATELKQRKDPPALAKIRLESFHEGPAAQIMYIGPYSDEGPTIERLHTFIHGYGHELAGKHHEIYLSDPRRTAPEKLKSIIRQPVANSFTAVVSFRLR